LSKVNVQKGRELNDKKMSVFMEEKYSQKQNIGIHGRKIFMTSKHTGEIEGEEIC